jgi:hypothetical protein
LSHPTLSDGLPPYACPRCAPNPSGISGQRRRKSLKQSGAVQLAEFTALKTTFSTAREGQVDAKGDLAQARANVASTRTALELQVGKNILAIASHHLGSRERAADYFNQSLLEDPTRSNDDVKDDETPLPAP